MRKYLIAVTIIAILIIAVILLGRTPQQKIYTSSYTATNIRFPYLADDHTVDFFSGHSFASYNLTDHTTKTLSPELTLPAISDMRWSHAGVLFKAGNSTAADDLYPAASALRLDPSQDYWVLYDFTTRHLSYVNGGSQGIQTTDAVWVNGESGRYDYASGDVVADSNNHVLFSDDGGIAQLEYASPAKIIYTTNSATPTLKEHDFATKTTSTLVSGTVKNIVVALSGDYLVYVDHYNTQATGDTPGDLELLNLQTHKTTRILRQFRGVTSLNSNDTLLISTTTAAGKVQLERYDLSAGKLTILSSSNLDQSNVAASLWVVNADNYLVENLANLLTVFRDQPASQPISPNYDYLIQGDLYQDGFEIHYRNDNGPPAYAVYVTKNPYAQYQQAALQYIRSQKIDPNLINIKWYGGDGVNRPTYVETPGSSG